MNKEEVQVWNECLMLWKELSNMPDTPVETRNADSFKQGILDRLGIGKRYNSCPLCEKYHKPERCPLGPCCSCYDYGYGNWEASVSHGMHVQEYAQKFYEELQKVYEKIREK